MLEEVLLHIKRNLPGYLGLFCSLFVLITNYFVQKTQSGAFELAIRKMISDRWLNFYEYKMRAIESKSLKTENSEKDIFNDDYDRLTAQITKLYQENIADAYEEACAKYLDKKVNRARFEVSYKEEIRELIETEPFNKFYENAPKGRYKATFEVYNKWNKNKG